MGNCNRTLRTEQSAWVEIEFAVSTESSARVDRDRSCHCEEGCACRAALSKSAGKTFSRGDSTGIFINYGDKKELAASTRLYGQN